MVGTDKLRTSTVHFFAACHVSWAPTITHGLHGLSNCSTNSSLLSLDWTTLTALSFTVSFSREKVSAYLCRVQSSSLLSSTSEQNHNISQQTLKRCPNSIHTLINDSCYCVTPTSPTRARFMAAWPKVPVGGHNVGVHQTNSRQGCSNKN